MFRILVRTNLLFFIMGVFIQSTPSQAVPELQLESRYQNEIFGFVDSKIVKGSFVGSKGILINFGVVTNPSSKGTVIILEGRTEYYKKYYEVIFDLFHLGYSIGIMDWASQGESGRFKGVHPEYTHAKDFSDHKKDLLQFMALSQIQTLKAQGNVFAIAHSMGGNILASALIDHPMLFDRVAFMAPMFDVRTDPFPEWLAYGVVWSQEALGLGVRKPPLASEFSENEVNNVTTSPQRRKVFFEQRLKFRDVLTGPVTASFGRAALEAAWFVQSRAADMKTPYLLFQAGSDQLVDLKGQDDFCAASQLYCNKVVYADAQHEILMEKDSIRTDALKKIDAFFVGHRR